MGRIRTADRHLQHGPWRGVRRRQPSGLTDFFFSLPLSGGDFVSSKISRSNYWLFCLYFISSNQLKVLAIGEDEKIKVKKGQKVIFRRYSGTDVKKGDKKYVLIKNEDILAVLE